MDHDFSSHLTASKYCLPLYYFSLLFFEVFFHHTRIAFDTRSRTSFKALVFFPFQIELDYPYCSHFPLIGMKASVDKFVDKIYSRLCFLCLIYIAGGFFFV